MYLQSIEKYRLLNETEIEISCEESSEKWSMGGIPDIKLIRITCVKWIENILGKQENKREFETYQVLLWVRKLRYMVI